MHLFVRSACGGAEVGGGQLQVASAPVMAATSELIFVKMSSFKILSLEPMELFLKLEEAFQ